jgi:DNA helicase-2/ATP-dependent DNA helicase PcrA
MSSDHIYSDNDFSDDFEFRREALEDLLRKINEAPVDIRKALLSFTASADPYQEKVLSAPENTIRLVAPAGSGKTQTIVNRVLTRVSKGLHPQRILLLTFDNSAVSAIKSKLEEQLSSLSIPLQGLTISTLNAFGYRFLRDHVPREHKPVLSKQRHIALIREVKKALEEKSPERFALLPVNVKDRVYGEFFSFLKNNLFDPRDIQPQRFADFMLQETELAKVFLSHLTDPGQLRKAVQALLWLFQAYELAMKRENVLDFDDQKLRAYSSLKADPQLLASIQSKFSEVIVDEFQDINLLDFVFIKALAEKAVLLVTGDDDQAIYGFRGCTPDYIIDLEKHLGRPVASYELQINYRCPANIVEHADKLIRHNNRRIPKSPIAANKTLSQIKVVRALTASLEAKSIVTFIRKVLKGNTTLKFSDCAVLYRTNAQSLPLQIEFILSDVPYYVRPEDSILNNDTLQKLLGVLRLKLALQSNTIPTLKDRRLTIQAYFRYLGPQQIESLDRLFQKSSDFFDAISSGVFFSVLPKAKDSLLTPSIREAIDAPNLIKTFDVLAKRFHGLKGMIGSLEDVVEEKVPLGELYDVAATFKGSVTDFVNTMEQALERARQSNAGQDQKTGVGLLTYFKSKGLQWHTVILTTCNDGLIPHKRASIEDERRLFYVAMTRASSNLLLSYLKNICRNSVSPSRFLKEAGLI